MVQRDLKIGLVLGLILVGGVLLKLVTDPDLSTEARMEQLQNSAAIRNSASPNDITREFVIDEIPSEQTDILENEHIFNISAQDEQLKTLFSSGKSQPSQPEPSKI